MLLCDKYKVENVKHSKNTIQVYVNIANIVNGMLPDTLFEQPLTRNFNLMSLHKYKFTGHIVVR